MLKSRCLAGIAAAAVLVASPVGLPGGLGDIAGPTAAQAQAANISISFFFGELAPHGTWVRHQRHRYVWVPNAVDADWAPYTNGRWVYTDRHGWLFVSDDPYGWATYHYGRWAREPGLGWYWVPGTVWAPAWVSWRRGPDYVGWAPLPPEDDGYAVRVEVTVREIPEERWLFVPTVRFLEPNLRTVIIRKAERPVIFQRTEYLGPVIVQNNTIVNNVIEVNYIEQQTNQTVVVNQIQTVDSPQPAQAAAGQGTVAVFSPQVTEPEPNATPPEVVEAEQVIQERQQSGAASADPAAAAGGTGTTGTAPEPTQAGTTTQDAATGADAAATQGATQPATGADAATTGQATQPGGADAATADEGTQPVDGADSAATGQDTPTAAGSDATTTEGAAEPSSGANAASTEETTEPAADGNAAATGGAPQPAAEEAGTSEETVEPAAEPDAAGAEATTEPAAGADTPATDGTTAPAEQAPAAADEAPAAAEKAPACTEAQRAADAC